MEYRTPVKIENGKGMRTCQSPHCHPQYIRPMASSSEGRRGKVVLAIFDCHDTVALQRLREVLPETALMTLEADEWNELSGDASAVSGRRPSQSMTARQRDILALLLKRFSNKEIARALGLSHFTVRNHVSRLLHHFGVATRRDLVKIAAGHRHV